MIATFYPGSSIRAQDLNDDFDQLRLAIQESKCAVENFRDELGDDFVEKLQSFTVKTRKLVSGKMMVIKTTLHLLVLSLHVMM